MLYSSPYPFVSDKSFYNLDSLHALSKALSDPDKIQDPRIPNDNGEYIIARPAQSWSVFGSYYRIKGEGKVIPSTLDNIVAENCGIAWSSFSKLPLEIAATGDSSKTRE